jgi:Tfp pilus assembly protein PilZ
VLRLNLALADKTEWVKVFDPRGGGLFVATPSPPEVGTEVRVDLSIANGGPRVILKGSVMFRRTEVDGRAPIGCAVGLAVSEREKINFLNGFVRGGLLNRRERRRLPLRLPITYGAVDGPRESFTRDINEEGLFILSDSPLPENTVLHMVLSLPGGKEPLQLKGVVSHTVIVEDEDVPGMGIVFNLSDAEQQTMTAAVDDLESRFFAGSLPDDVIG